ncbi:hypothetical protein [Sporosarcina jiandibaonis]|uniref:hypothetical protein n=1 Tax=Sporosarcina jiandibaonis TaxID=2715535 RepID=UPI001554415F|nr:hypothetical protein [Sporosarcina jiandibaonis]
MANLLFVILIDADFQLTNLVAIGVTNYKNAIQFYQTVFGTKFDKILRTKYSYRNLIL